VSFSDLISTPDLGYDLHVAGVAPYHPVERHAQSIPADDGRAVLIYQDEHRRIGLIGTYDDLRAVLNAWRSQLDEMNP
jgi:hypothetical protein